MIPRVTDGGRRDALVGDKSAQETKRLDARGRADIDVVALHAC